MLKYLAAFLLFASSAFAQSDSGLIPNNTVLGNTSGVRGSARPIPMPSSGVTSIDGATGALTLGTGLTRSGQDLRANVGTSGATIPLNNGANTWSSAQTFSANPTLSSIVNCTNGLVTNGSGQVQCGTGGSNNLPIFPVKSYGAACNGSTNDAAAISAAISAAQAAGGGIVQFPASYCAIQSTVTVPEVAFGFTKIVIQGAGLWNGGLAAKSPFTGTCMLDVKGSILVQNIMFNSGTEIGVPAPGVSVNGFCNSRVGSGGGIDHAIIEKVVFHDFRATNAKCVYNGGADTTVATTSVLNSTFNLCYYSYYSDKWNVGAVINGNHMFNTGGAIYLGSLGGPYGHTEGVNITNNEIISASPLMTGSAVRPLEIASVCYDCHISKNILDAEPVGAGNCTSNTKAVRVQNSATSSFEQNWFAKGLIANGSYNNQLRVVNNSFPDKCQLVIDNMNGGSIIGNSFFGADEGPTNIVLSITNSNFFAVVGNTFQNDSAMATGGTISNCSITANVASGTSGASAPCVGAGNSGAGMP